MSVMSTVLVDTTVASFLHPRKRGTEIREKYNAHRTNRILALSFQSVAELWHWAETCGWGEKARNELDTFLRRFLIIPWDYELTRIWARVMRKSSQIGRRFEVGDCWIAATAIQRRIPLLTRDRDFVGLSIPGLHVISYAEPRPATAQQGSDQEPG